MLVLGRWLTQDVDQYGKKTSNVALPVMFILRQLNIDVVVVVPSYAQNQETNLPRRETVDCR